MMTLKQTNLLLSCVTIGLLGILPACDKGPKSLGNDGGSETGDGDGETGDGDGDTGDGDTGDGDGDTGDGDGDGDGGTGGCGAQTVTVIDSLDGELTGLGFTASEYLAQSEGTYLGEMNWLANDGFVEVAHAGSSSPLTATVTYAGGEIRLTEVELAGEFPNEDLGGVLCANFVEIDVTLDFVTDDGLFAESMTVPMRAQAPSGDPVPAFYLSLDMGALQGELGVEDFTPIDSTIHDYVLLGGFQENQFGGSFNLEVEAGNAFGFGSVAIFVADRQE